MYYKRSNSWCLAHSRTHDLSRRICILNQVYIQREIKWEDSFFSFSVGQRRNEKTGPPAMFYFFLDDKGVTKIVRR